MIRSMDHKQRYAIRTAGSDCNHITVTVIPDGRLSSETTEQLEVESRRMEDRLHVLREMMSAEKARRG